MRPPRALLRDRTITQLQQLARDGFETVKQMADPPVTVTTKRWSDAAQDFVEVGTVEAAVRYSETTGAGADVSDSTETSQTRGTVRHEAPWDLAIGDRFILPGGSTAVVVAPAPYERFGVIRGTFVVDQGAA